MEDLFLEITAAMKLAENLMQAHALRGWTFAFNRRKRALGLCRYGPRRIELSLPFVLNNDELAVRDTILHEIAHALAGEQVGHGPQWQNICMRIGATPVRCDYLAIMPAGRWQGMCPSCGKSYSRHRKPMRNRIYCCRACGRDRGQIHFRAVAIPA